MRHWIFHPLIFYPLAIIIAAVLILASLQPQKWARTPAPAAAELVESALVYEGEAFNAPDPSPEQNLVVVRSLWGRPQAMRIAVLRDQPAPTPAEQGVRILMTPEDAARIDDRPVTIELSYNPIPYTTSQAVAVSLQGIGPATWVSQPILAEPGTLRFELPAQFAVNAIGIRAIHDGGDRAFGLEVTRIRVIPHA